MKITKQNIAEVLIVLLVIAIIYIPLKFLLRGTLPYLPEQAGTVDLAFIVGLIFMVMGVGAAFYYLQTPKIESLPAISLGLLVVCGFMLVHLSQSGYQYPVAVMPLSLLSDTQQTDYSFLVLPLILAGASISLFNFVKIFNLK